MADRSGKDVVVRIADRAGKRAGEHPLVKVEIVVGDHLVQEGKQPASSLVLFKQ